MGKQSCALFKFLFFLIGLCEKDQAKLGLSYAIGISSKEDVSKLVSFFKDNSACLFCRFKRLQKRSVFILAKLVQ